MSRVVKSIYRRVNTGRVVEKKRKEFIQNYPELHAMFLKYMQAFHADGGYNYNQQDIKVLQLFDLLVKKRPENMVEYGTGSTSLAFAYYATKYGANYLGVEESAEWAKLNNERLRACIPNLKNARIEQHEKVDNHSATVYYSYSTFTPEIHYDFMLIDGPSFSVDRQHTKKINTDIKKYSTVGLPETILVDNRKETVAWLKENLEVTYEVQDSSNWELTKSLLSPQDYQYYSLFEIGVK